MQVWALVAAGSGLAATAGCGVAHNAVAPTKPTPSVGYVYEDGDHDEDESPTNRRPNDDTSLNETYGAGANQADTRAISTLVKRYLTAAATGDVATGCRLLATALVRQLEQAQGRSGCPSALAAELALQHQLLVAEQAGAMEVLYVHVKGALGLAALRFRTVPEQSIIVEREGSAWKIDALTGSNMT
jgi:hypothetical protein